jgi:hypothetical protein
MTLMPSNPARRRPACPERHHPNNPSRLGAWCVACPVASPFLARGSGNLNELISRSHGILFLSEDSP